MAAKTDILTFKHDIPALKTPTNGGTLVDKLFENFIGYAGANWKYAAQQGAQTAEDALDGTGTKTLACATIRKALQIMVRDTLNVPTTNTDINEYFITRPGLKCFDPTVTGNVGSRGTGAFNLGCHFSTHYFLNCNGKFYDPCLTSVYGSADGPVMYKTFIVKGPLPSSPSVPPIRKAGTGTSLMFFCLIPGRAVPGFGSVWEVVKPAELKNVLSSNDYKIALTDPVVKAAGLK